MRMVFATLILALAPGAQAGSVEFEFAPGGFDDPTPTTPVGGNTGTTLGEQRRILLQTAGQIWADLIDSNVPIVVDVSFETFGPGGCTNTGAILGFAGPFTTQSGGLSIPLALANAQNGSDIFPGTPDISAQFNSDIDTGCFGGGPFYYGLDGNPPANTTSLFSTVLHELAHGLGFSSGVEEDNTTGDIGFTGAPTVFDTWVFDREQDKFLDEMNATEVMIAAENAPDVVWVGPNVDAEAENFLTSGLNMGTARVYAPGTFEPGSSLSHFASDSTPDLLMEPFAGNQAFDQVDLTPFLFQDLGYTIDFGAVDTVFADGFEGP